MTALIVDPPVGRVPPFTPAAQARLAAGAADARQHPADGPENRFLQERCLSFNAAVRPWKGLLPMRRSTEPLFEYACHEGNHALMDILRGARYEETHR